MTWQKPCTFPVQPCLKSELTNYFVIKQHLKIYVYNSYNKNTVEWTFKNIFRLVNLITI